MSAIKKPDTAVIRPAVRSDSTEIYRLIKDLGNYLSMGDHIKITKQALENDGFGETAFFQCLVVDNPDYSEAHKSTASPGLIGHALYYFTYSTFDGRCIFMEDLYVSPAYRNQGIGTRLMKGVAQVGLDNGCSRLSWNVLGDNVSTANFYKQLGAEDLTEKEGWHGFNMNRITMEKFVKE